MVQINENSFHQEVLNLINTSHETSHSDFEKSLTYISSGVLVGSLFFIEKIIPLASANAKLFLLLTWVFSGITLLISLISHYLSSIYHGKTSSEILELDEITEELRVTINDNIKSRNAIISCLNISSLISLIIGIIQLVLFVSLNLF